MFCFDFANGRLLCGLNLKHISFLIEKTHFVFHNHHVSFFGIYLSITGEFSEGHKVFFYLSSIDFEATYTYIEKLDFQISMLRVYSINSMDSQSPQICKMQRDWIQALKRHSILISESGEAQRIDFIKRQRSVIDIL